MAKKIVRKKGLVFEEVDGLIHILDEEKDAIITLNNTASFLWKKLSKSLSLEELAKNLASEFNIKFDKALKDSKELVEKLTKRKLLNRI